MYNFNGVFTALVVGGLFIGLVLWGAWELIDLIFIDDAIKTTSPLVPEIELIIKDNKIDTLYVYRQP